MRMGTANQGFIYRTRVAADAAGASVLGFSRRLGSAIPTRPPGAPRSTSAACSSTVAALRPTRCSLPATSSSSIARLGREPDAPESFAVAFEDEHVLVVVKPAGLQVLPAGPFSARTLLTLVRASDASRAAAAPAHRLGRGTSGLIAFGRPPSAAPR